VVAAGEVSAARLRAAEQLAELHAEISALLTI
jgi:hypothetical protein